MNGGYAHIPSTRDCERLAEIWRKACEGLNFSDNAWDMLSQGERDEGEAVVHRMLVNLSYFVGGETGVKIRDVALTIGVDE